LAQSVNAGMDRLSRRVESRLAELEERTRGEQAAAKQADAEVARLTELLTNLVDRWEERSQPSGRSPADPVDADVPHASVRALRPHSQP
jgi:phage shock protein A